MNIMMTHLPEFIVHHWDLWLALGIILILLLIYELRTYQTIQLPPQEAVLFINRERAAIIDIRSADAFKQGHIINAVHAKPDDYKTASFAKYKTKPLLIVCSANANAVQIKKQWSASGFAHVHTLAGGIEAWQTAGLPLIKDVP